MMVLEEIGKSPYPEMEEILSSPRDKIGTKLDNLPRVEAAVVGGSEEHQENRPEPPAFVFVKPRKILELR